MTSDELTRQFDIEFGSISRWPATYEVDHETYANVCQAVFDFQFRNDKMFFWDTVEDGEQKPAMKVLTIAVGKNRGIMFKNVELILDRGQPDGR